MISTFLTLSPFTCHFSPKRACASLLLATVMAGCSAVNVMEFDDGFIRNRKNGEPVVTAGLAMGPDMPRFLRDSSRNLKLTFDPILYAGIRQGITPMIEASASAWWTSMVPVFPVFVFQQGDGGGQVYIKFGHTFAGSPGNLFSDYNSVAVKVFGSAYGVIRSFSNDADERANGFTLDWGPVLTLAHDFRSRKPATAASPSTESRSDAVIYLGLKLHFLRSKYEYGLDASSTNPSRQTGSVVSNDVAYNPFIGVSLADRSFSVEFSGLMAKNPWSGKTNYGLYVGAAVTR